MKHLALISSVGVAASLLIGCSDDDLAQAKDAAGAGAQGYEENAATGGGSASGGSAASGGSTATGGSTASGGDTATGGSTASGGSSATGGATASGGTSGSIEYGSVNFVAFYEQGSAWIGASAAQAMVEKVFADFEANLTTSGEFDATIEVYFTDNNPDYANTYFSTSYVEKVVNGEQVKVVGPWAEIVLGDADLNGAADNQGNGFDFAISFNVNEQGDNEGLLRHEMMHGLGAVTAVNYFTMSTNDVFGPTTGTRAELSLYDTLLVDKSGAAVWEDYQSADGSFALADLDVDTTYTDWTDGEAGLYLRGISDAGQPFDMQLGTAPSAGGAVCRTNEPYELMSSGGHPTWNTIAEPDRAYFRAMGYHVRGD